MADVVESEITVRFDLIVDGQAFVHELALDGDEDLAPRDRVVLVSDGAPMRRAFLTEIDVEGYFHLQLLD